MKSATPALVTLLASGKPLMFTDLYSIDLASGTQLRWHTADYPFTITDTDGVVYQKTALTLRRGNTKIVVGVEVDNLELDVGAIATDTIDGVPFNQALRQGAFDKADFLLKRGVFDGTLETPWAQVAQISIMFGGTVGEVYPGRFSSRLTIVSHLELLNVSSPMNLYQPPCQHVLYDAGCGLTRASFVVSNAATSGSTRSQINNTLAQAADYFTQGVLTFTSGVNDGQSRTVKSYAPGVLTVPYPFLTTPGVGDTFHIVPGCDHRQTTCDTKFTNVVHFKGFPCVPAPEAAA